VSPFARMFIIAAALAAGMAPPVFADSKVKSSLDWKFEGPAAPFPVALDEGKRQAVLRHRRPQVPRHHRRPEEPGGGKTLGAA
jgi:hypothetical protein